MPRRLPSLSYRPKPASSIHVLVIVHARFPSIHLPATFPTHTTVASILHVSCTPFHYYTSLPPHHAVDRSEQVSSSGRLPIRRRLDLTISCRKDQFTVNAVYCVTYQHQRYGDFVFDRSSRRETQGNPLSLVPTRLPRASGKVNMDPNPDSNAECHRDEGKVKMASCSQFRSSYSREKAR